MAIWVETLWVLLRYGDTPGVIIVLPNRNERQSKSSYYLHTTQIDAIGKQVNHPFCR